VRICKCADVRMTREKNVHTQNLLSSNPTANRVEKRHALSLHALSLQ
jgi:hypothetical protein